MSTAQHRTATERPRPVTSATYVRLGSCLLPVHVRSAVVMVITAVLGCVVFVGGLGMGDYPLPISTVVDVLTGGGTRLERTVVFD
ncbi:hypothetical protein [Kocuria sp. cx-116]|uniref:hypothetical protein n=1 Tax=Kocuria sp. cx-116 TaxID=2771378 RepID=UPI001CC231E9|nr:hypothetical protein [Kocuria sp. cx-116]